MPDIKDFSIMTLEELLVEEKKNKNLEITSSLLVGFAAGVMIYGLVKNGFGLLYTVIPIILIAVTVKQSQNRKQELKQIQTEINNKKV